MGRAIEIVTAARADPAPRWRCPTGSRAPPSWSCSRRARPADGQPPDRAALERELEKLRAELRRAEGMLGNERFTSKAPPEVVAAEREKAERFAADVRALESRLAALE